MWSSFTDHLKSFLGGSRKEEQTVRHKTQCQKILTFVTSSLDDSNTIAELSDLITNKTKTNEWKANTCRAYIGSLQLFVKFVQTMAGLGQRKYTSFRSDGLHTLNLNLASWNKSLNKMSRKEHLDKLRSLTPEDIVNPDDIQKYLQCSNVAKALAILDAVSVDSSDVKIIDQPTHTRVRNHLLFRLAIANAQRTGCLTNMTLEQFHNKRRRKDHFLVNVEDHKTNNSYGCAELIVSTELYQQLEKYVQCIRPSSSADQFFLNWSGRKMTAGDVAHALSTELGHAGVEKR